MDGAGSKPGQPSGSFFTPLLISMTGILITSLALVAYHFFIVRYCLRQRLRSNISAVSQTVPDQQFTKRVEEKILITIPILSYSSTKNDSNTFLLDQTECVICLGDLQDGDMVRLLPNCRHSFHVPCIDNWFQRHCSCPICRSPMVEPSSTNPSVALPVNVSDNRNEVAQRQDGETSLTSAGEVSVTSSGIESSTGLLGDSVSTVLSMEGKPQFWAAAALKRSLSMNQYYDLVNLERVSRKEESSSSSSSRNILMERRSFRAQSMKQLDRMSSRLVRSFSQLKVSRSGSTTNQILPY